jgi:hypothetical protein
MPIIFSPQGMVEQVKKNPATVLDKEICASHIVNVWEAVSGFIIQNLCQGRGVKIPRKQKLFHNKRFLTRFSFIYRSRYHHVQSQDNRNVSTGSYCSKGASHPSLFGY